MNTKTRKTNNGNTKGEPKSFTPRGRVARY